MIHIEEISETEITYWFTKGISMSDIQELIDYYQSRSKVPLQEIAVKHISNQEYFPTTKNYINKYRTIFTNEVSLEQ